MLKALGVAALVVVVALVSFYLGALAGMGGLMIAWIVGAVLAISVPSAAAILGVLAGAFWCGAKASGGKPRWDIFGKVSAAVMALTVTGSLIFAVNAIANMRF